MVIVANDVPGSTGGSVAQLLRTCQEGMPIIVIRTTQEPPDRFEVNWIPADIAPAALLAEVADKLAHLPPTLEISFPLILYSEARSTPDGCAHQAVLLMQAHARLLEQTGQYALRNSKRKLPRHDQANHCNEVATFALYRTRMRHMERHSLGRTDGTVSHGRRQTTWR